MLEELGLDCDMVADGKQALDILRNSAHDKPYTLVFMDCQMPVLDGYATTECIRKGDAGERYITIPIVAMTAHAIAGNREKCLNSGMNDYISKPLEHETLFSILLTWLKPGDDTPQKGQNLSRPPANSGVNNDVLQTTLDDHIYWKSNDALRRVAGKPERLRKLITMYFNDMPSRIANLQQQLSDLDMAEAARNLHTIKSVAGNLGGSKLQEIATIMERYAQNGLQQEVAEALPALLDANEQLSNALEGYLKQSAPSAPN
jgi:CheY-like chemotaxis protein